MKTFHGCYFMLLLIIFISLYQNYLNVHYQNSEGFTPRIREMYRPYIRQTRILSEGLYNKNKDNINNILRKFGLI
jgi:hypothetical protein